MKLIHLSHYMKFLFLFVVADVYGDSIVDIFLYNRILLYYLLINNLPELNFSKELSLFVDECLIYPLLFA